MASLDAAPPLVEFACTLTGSVLWGITCMQTFLYFVYHNTHDSIGMKLMVVWLWIMDTIHMVIVDRGFWVLVYKVHDPFILSTEYLVAGLFTALVALPVQLFFTYRIWIFSQRMWIVPLVFIPASLYQFAGYIAFTVICLKNGPTAKIIFDIERLPQSIWGVGAAQDMLISGLLLWMIWRDRVNMDDSRISARSARILQRLSIAVINSGLWTALTSLFIIIMMVVYPAQQIYVSLYFIVGPLYCNSLLANLNARNFIRGKHFTTNVTSGYAPDYTMSEFTPARPGGDTSTQTISLAEPTFSTNSEFDLAVNGKRSDSGEETV
ncbi:hypothetical protein BDZ89DRAFT_1022050 [Hymenopellis radicata]|nr:hypothetical protein BDZ89DRAFT_1022050 [Hymenopellis radicata]